MLFLELFQGTFLVHFPVRDSFGVDRYLTVEIFAKQFQILLRCCFADFAKVRGCDAKLSCFEPCRAGALFPSFLLQERSLILSELVPVVNLVLCAGDFFVQVIMICCCLNVCLSKLEPPVGVSVCRTTVVNC